jgi:methylated-DNA-[protein]-cysteine S-methyltransferase
MNLLTAEIPTPAGQLWVAGDSSIITSIAWEPIVGRQTHHGELDWFLEALENYFALKLKVFPGALGFNGQKPIWLKDTRRSTGVSFTHKTYQAMCAIPYGQTKSYADVGQTLGNRYLARAVGNVCAANPVPIVVPCHRVVGAHSLGGYSGGLDKKNMLLRLEGSLVS